MAYDISYGILGALCTAPTCRGVHRYQHACARARAPERVAALDGEDRLPHEAPPVRSFAPHHRERPPRGVSRLGRLSVVALGPLSRECGDSVHRATTYSWVHLGGKLKKGNARPWLRKPRPGGTC